ncbi:MAG: cyclic nucleotide-binding domain-containing protein [Magnetococcales bacterium]|nr:cyclic nucleotide-binding domain-containing protein [Magnetococcales bacterium]
MSSSEMWKNKLLSKKLLKHVPFFHPFTDEELDDLLIENDFFTTVETGKTLIEVGTEYDKDLFILIKGEVQITDQNGEHITYLKSGEIFGEISFLTKGCHITNVVALCDLVIFQITNNIFDKVSKDLQLRIKDGLILTLVTKLENTNKELVAKDRSNLALLNKVRELTGG